MAIKLQEKNGAIDLTKKMFKGDDGGYYVPSVDEEGNLTWTPSEEDMEAVEAANIRGPRGIDGVPGKNSVWCGDEEPGEDFDVWIAPAGEESQAVVTYEEMVDYVAEHVGEGSSGATFIPSVSAEGIISWTNDKDLENPSPVDIKGPAGEKGDKGDQGIQGEQGPQGEKGDTGPQGEQGPIGETGPAGADGAQGEPGEDGYTPVKGTDYWTAADKQEIINDVLAALPAAEEVSV